MPRVRLGELLLSRGVCTRAQLAEAWEQKVVFGDRLGTNLMAIGAVDEAQLAAALGAQHGVHGGHGGVLRVDPAAVALVPRPLALRRRIVPHHVADRVLFLLMTDPDDLPSVDEVRFATRLKVQPVVVAEARMWRLLSEWYGARPPLRPNPLDARPRPVAAAPAASTTAPAEDLVSEEEFQALYARLASGAGRDPWNDVPPTSPIDAAPPAAARDAGLDETTRPIRMRRLMGQSLFEEDIPRSSAAEPPAATMAPDPTGSPSVAAAPSLAPSPSASPVPEAWARSLQQTNPMRAQQKSPALDAIAEIELVEVADEEPDTVPPDAPSPFPPSGNAVPVVPAPPDLSPLSFDEAVAALQTASGRDDIARVVLRGARASFSRACLLTVYPDAFIGWQGVGEGFETEKLIDVVIPRDDPSVFRLVVDSRAHYIGPLQRFPAHGAWVKATGRKIPRSLAVLPILVRERPVNLLIVDNGHDQHVGDGVGALLILARHIAGTYESLIQKG